MKMDFAARAQALVGMRFRAQARGEGGLDCVGVVLATFRIPHDAAPSDYPLRGDHLREVRNRLEAHFRRVPTSQAREGDVMLFELARDQVHLAVRTNRGFVHGHAGLRRVVETPGAPEWPLAGVYRKRRSR